jgi:hypothetical protein
VPGAAGSTVCDGGAIEGPAPIGERPNRVDPAYDGISDGGGSSGGGVVVGLATAVAPARSG